MGADEVQPAKCPRADVVREGVQMIGDLDLIGRRQAFGGHNLTFEGRLLDWLSRKNS